MAPAEPGPTCRCIIPDDDSPLWEAVPLAADGVDFYELTIPDGDPLLDLIDPAYLITDERRAEEATPTLA